MQANSTKQLTIAHFNDVYDISEKKDTHHCGGVARFITKIKQIKEKDPNAIVLFSGDLWSPSRCKLFLKLFLTLKSNFFVPWGIDPSSNQQMLD